MTNQTKIEVTEEEYQLLLQISASVPRLVKFLRGDPYSGYQQEEAECARVMELVRRLPQRSQKSIALEAR